MDTDLLKAALPAIGGALALLGGVFTFVSGRLRDAPDESAKAHVLFYTWNVAAIISWLIGVGCVTFTPMPLFSIPFYSASMAIQWAIFVSGPEPASRAQVATFAVLCAITAFAMAFAFLVYSVALLGELQVQQMELLRKTIEAMTPTPK